MAILRKARTLLTTDEGNTLGSPKLPADPPLELDGMPAAQKVWIELVTFNPALRDLDFYHVLDYCIAAQQLARLDRAKKTLGPDGRGYDQLLDRMDVWREFMWELYRDMWPGDQQGDPPGLLED